MIELLYIIGNQKRRIGTNPARKVAPYHVVYADWSATLALTGLVACIYRFISRPGGYYQAKKPESLCNMHQ